jgi:hypothetical protein
MSCDKCKYFHILYEPLRGKEMLFDLGRVKCEKHDQITDFANHGKFKRLDTCEDFELAESEVQDADSN